MNYYHEWPSIPIPEWLQKQGWNDRSYHNDLCARSEVDLFDGRTLRVWVDHLDKARREFPEYTRYAIYVHADDDDLDGQEIYLGESDTEAAQAVFRFLVHFTVESMKNDIAEDPRLLACRSYSELHDHCDANLLGCSEWAFETFGADYHVDVFNAASDIVSAWLKDRPAVVEVK